MKATLRVNSRINGVPVASFGTLLANPIFGTAMQAGQMVGAAMPDTEAGNVLKGVFDPLSNVGAGLAYMSEGNIGKGLLSLIPGVGTYLQGRDARNEEARIKALQEATAKRDYIENNRNSSIADLNNYTPTNSLSMFANGGKINGSFLPIGGSQINLPASGSPMTRGASLITTPNGSTSGSHEAGNNIPVIGKNGQPVAIAEPGEVVTNDGDVSLIISKRDGLAQQYMAVENQKQSLLSKIEKAKTPEAKAGLARSIEYLDTQLDAIKQQQQIISSQLAQLQNQQQGQQGQQGQSQQQIPVAGGGLNLTSYDPNNLLDYGKGYGKEYDPNNPYSLNQFPALSFDPIPETFDQTISPFDPRLTNSINGINTNKKSSSLVPPPRINRTMDNIKQGIGMLLPSMMNYKNQKAMRDSMEEIMNNQPVPNKVNYITPDFQIGDQTAAINNNFAVSRDIADKVSNPLVASSIISNASADRARSINALVGEKNRSDMQTGFMQTNNINTVNMNNVAAINANKRFQLESRLSQNNALINLNNTTAQSIYAMIQEGNLKDRDKSTLMLAIKQLNQYGIIDRNMIPFLQTVGIDTSSIKTGTIPK